MRKGTLISLVSAGALALAGCFAVEFAIEAPLDVDASAKFGKMNRECVSDNPNIDATPMGEFCQIRVKSFRATLVDMKEVKVTVHQKIVDNGKDPADVGVSIDGMKITIKRVQLKGENGQDVTPPQVEAFAAIINLDGVEFLRLEGTQLQRLLLGETVAIMTPKQVEKVADAYEKDLPVEMDGSATFMIRNVDMANLSMAGEISLGLGLHIDVAATGSKDAI